MYYNFDEWNKRIKELELEIKKDHNFSNGNYIFNDIVESVEYWVSSFYVVLGNMEGGTPLLNVILKNGLYLLIGIDEDYQDYSFRIDMYTSYEEWKTDDSIALIDTWNKKTIQEVVNFLMVVNR